MTAENATPSRIFLGYIVDIAAPLAGYFILHSLRVPDFWSLVAGTVVAVLSTAVNSVRRRKLDGVGLLVILEIVVSIGLLFVTGDPRFLLAKPSFYTGLAGIYILATLFRAKPVTYEGVRQIGARGDPLRVKAFERAWDRSREFRTSLRVSAIGWGVAFLADAVIRVVIVYRFPLTRAIWLSNLPNLIAIVILVGFSALMGRTTKRIIEEEVRQIVTGANPV